VIVRDGPQYALASRSAASIGLLLFLCCIPISLRSEPVFDGAASRFDTCLKSSRQYVKGNDQPVEIELYKELWNLCSQQVANSLSYDDYAVRREKFLRQNFDERVNLILVVAITLSGVLLSFLQMWGAYKLAVMDKGAPVENTELAVERGKLSLKTSITGAVIMALSLMFFIVYVRWIYMIQEVTQPKPAATHIPPGKLLSGGALGPPAPVVGPQR